MAALIMAGLLAALLWRFGTSAPESPASDKASAPNGLPDTVCPTPLGLKDLEFAYIEPDVVDAGNHKIVVEDAFCIATKEVSRRDWLEVMGGELPQPEQSLDVPMTRVTIENVNLFLEALETREPESTFRLPTADEWEFAARAGSETDFFFGDDPSQLHRYGNCKNTLGSDGFEGPAAIGSYKANTWGLYDVHGNVAEWVQWPKDEERLNDKGKLLALRLGGSFSVKGCSFSSSKSRVQADNGSRDDTGFRVVREIDDGDRS